MRPPSPAPAMGRTSSRRSPELRKIVDMPVGHERDADHVSPTETRGQDDVIVHPRTHVGLSQDLGPMFIAEDLSDGDIPLYINLSFEPIVPFGF